MADTSVDAGLQAERTELAWRRTQLSLLVVACLALRGQNAAVVLIGLIAAGLIWLRQQRSYQHSLAMLREERGQARVLTVLGTGLMLVAMAALAMLHALTICQM
ncbi:DUF202 domain-containing protein [Pseudomonas stutzeri]|uniref:DUF202 domain-containing protein n=1 Tax=Stutzerimonas stutzeri TaxID=316 RepID=UPI00210CA90E|nr:DUF202 domain-containing protein [Stutzerimonas stutzeri]MCQ4288792.1 DUF202 domain-containing protein [Stutzerimonas stutzeri]